jgi:3-hydroxyacyl-[acyl-carrier-protein] dehydratase
VDVPDVNATDPGELLPHGHPALQVDRILRRERRRLVAAKAISYHELGGHLGDRRPAAFPASLVIESFVQACGLLGAPADGTSGSLLIFGSASGIHVSGAAYAGDVLVHVVELVDRYGDTATFAGTSRVGAKTVLSVERVTTVLRPADAFA